MKKMDDWRNNRRGIQFSHEPTQFLITGAPDEIWVSSQQELIVVDVKATSKESEVNLDADWQISYKQQMEIYQWLFLKNGFKVSNRGYFIYCNGKRDTNSSGVNLAFDVTVLPYEGNVSWIEPALNEIWACLQSKQIPSSAPDCKLCCYRNTATETISTKSQEAFVT